MLPLVQINDKLANAISVNSWLRLRTAINFIVAKNFIRENNSGMCIGLTDFLARKGKGSKCFRIVIGDLNDNNHKAMNLINTFVNLLELPVPDPDTCKLLSGLWNQSLLPNYLRCFIFQIFSNSLPVGAWVGNRYQDRRRIRFAFSALGALNWALVGEMIHPM